MTLRPLIGLGSLAILFILAIVGDWYFASAVENKSQIETYPTELTNIVPLKETLIAFENQKNLDIPIDELLFYQEKYKQIPQLDCKKDLDLRLKRSYIIDITTFDKNKLLQGGQ